LPVVDDHQSIMSNFSRAFFSQWYRSLLLCVALLIPLTPFRSEAQISLDGSVGPQGALTGPNYVIPAEVGKQQGHNLFHSFGAFNVQTGESATFTGPDSVNNVLARVTGGQQSFIDGPLRSEIPEANLYLLNPSGVLFGANASLEVGGSFHVSTADTLHFSDNSTFHTDLGKTSTFSVAEPTAFGFLNRQPAPITINNSALEVTPGHTLSVVGGNIEINGNLQKPFATRNLAAPGGHLNLVSLGNEGTVRFDESGRALSPDNTTALKDGSVTIAQGGLVSVNGSGGGTLTIRGGHFAMDFAVMNAATIDEHPGAVDIQARSVELRGGSVIRTSTSTAAPAGNLTINATESVAIVGSDANGNISATFSNSFSPGNTGQVSITTPTLTIDGGKIQAAAGNSSTGTGGDIVVKAKQVVLTGGGQLDSTSFGSGSGGRLSANATESVKIVANTGKGGQSGLFSNAQGKGSRQQEPRPDALIVSTPFLEMKGGS
jgi:filamentous hemagglutinin family protein